MAAPIVAILMALASALLTNARAEGAPTSHGPSPIYLPVVYARPLGCNPTFNPACTSPGSAATVHGIVYIDTNRNGRYEPQEILGGWDVPVEGSQVYLQRSDWAEPRVATPANGYYCFEGLEPGDYSISVTLSAEDQLVLEPLDDDRGDVRLLDGQAVSRDFRYERWYRPPTQGPRITLYFPAVAR